MMHSGDNQHKSTNTKSVSKAFAILSTFDETTPMQRTSDIAIKLNMNISTVSRHLNTMLDWGFLERDEDTGFYYPGMGIISLAGITLQNNDVFRHAFPELQIISHKYRIHSHMGVPRLTEVYHLISVCCENTSDLLIPMGHRHPMYCSAMGRAMLAYMPYSRAQDILKNSNIHTHTSHTKIDLGEINKELALTKKRGYCILKDELIEGKASLSAPVFDRNREPIAAISVSTSSHALSQLSREKELAKVVITAANKISCKLGYYPK